MTTYTVIDYNGEPQARHLDVADAADIILSTDGREWQIRRTACGEGWEIWSRHQVANRPWTKTVIQSFATTEVDAKAQMFAGVVKADFHHHYTAMTDDAFDRMAAELEADEG